MGAAPTWAGVKSRGNVPRGCPLRVASGHEMHHTLMKRLHMSQQSNAFACFMASATGRLVRIAAGLALIGWGWSRHDTTSGTVLMVVGLVPLLTGVFNVCLIAPIIGAPFSGRAARENNGQV